MLLLFWSYYPDCPIDTDTCGPYPHFIGLGTMLWDNVEASIEPAPTHPDLGIGSYCGYDETDGDIFGPGDVWVYFRRICPFPVRISTDGSTGISDTLLEVWPGASCGGFDYDDLIACNDDIDVTITGKLGADR